jgi:hypothetical protein
VGASIDVRPESHQQKDLEFRWQICLLESLSVENRLTGTQFGKQKKALFTMNNVVFKLSCF